MTTETDILESNEKAPKMADKFESINIEGKQQTGIWEHHPGSDVSQTWEPRKRKCRHPETQIYREHNNSMVSPGSVASVSFHTDSSTDDENPEGKRFHPLATIRKNLKKFGLVFNRSPGNESSNNKEEAAPTLGVNVRSVDDKRIGVKFVVEDSNSGAVRDQKAKKETLSSGRSEVESQGKGRRVAKSILKQAGKSAHNIKHAMGRKISSKPKDSPGSAAEEKDHQVFDYSDEESLPPSKEFSPTVEGMATDSAFLLFLNGKESPNSSGEFPANVQPDSFARDNQESLERKVSFHGNDRTESLERKVSFHGNYGMDGFAVDSGESLVENVSSKSR